MLAVHRLLLSQVRHLRLTTRLPMPTSEDSTSALDRPCPSSPALIGMRKLLDTHRLDAYLVPSEDYHDSEYIADCDKRRQFLTNFTGSAGFAIVTPSKALLWTDGRYHLQAAQQLDDNWILMKMGLPEVPKPSAWLSKELPPGGVVGVDPRQLSNSSYKTFRDTLKAKGRRLRSVTEANLVDAVWHNRPARPTNPLMVVPIDCCGETWQEKVARVRTKIAEDNCFALAITALDEIAWLFNLRGSDIPHNPVFFAFAIVTQETVHLCMDSTQIDCKIKAHLTEAVQLHSYDDFGRLLQDIANRGDGKTEGSGEEANGESTSPRTRVWIPSQADQGSLECVPKELRHVASSPLASMKAVKNPTEIACMERAHVLDAVALCEFLLWLEETVGKEEVTEWIAAQKLDNLRAQQSSFVSLSFDTISASGPNGAIIHYKPMKETSRRIQKEDLYLVDSGGQYMAGTTDITRTVHLSTPSDEQRANFTRVLKGHIALSRIIFPSNTNGSSIDCLARAALWREGLDYNHGTGHGVGAFLNVHEGPHGISGTRSFQEEGIKEGMYVTIEPGYYKANEYGIRIENVFLVVKADTPNRFNDRDFLTFKAISLAPLQAALIDPRLLTEEEIAWINAYHAHCLDVVGAELEVQGKHKVLKWLSRECSTLG